MTVIYGALGAIIVLVLFGTGFLLGWKVHDSIDKHRRQVQQDALTELTEEQKRQAREEREAFERLMQYSVEQAYGLTPTLQELAKKE